MIENRRQILQLIDQQPCEKCCLRRNAFRATIHSITSKDVLMLVSEYVLENLKIKIADQLQNHAILNTDFQLLVDILRAMYAILCYTAKKIQPRLGTGNSSQGLQPRPGTGNSSQGLKFEFKNISYEYGGLEITTGPASDLMSCYNLDGFPANEAFFYLLNTNILRNYLIYIIQSSDCKTESVVVELYKNIEANIYLEVLYPKLYDLVVNGKPITEQPEILNSNKSKVPFYNVWKCNTHRDTWKKIRLPRERQQLQKKLKRNLKSFETHEATIWCPNGRTHSIKI